MRSVPCTEKGREHSQGRKWHVQMSERGKTFGADEEMCLVGARKSSVRLQKSIITDQAGPL